MIQGQIDQAAETKSKGRVALLIDGENISSDLAGQIIMKSLALGALVIKRVYGNAAKMPKWDAAPGIKLVHSGTGKNATDLLLAIEAVSLSHEASVETFVIASSDRDFTHLAHHLRERSFGVVGMGEEKAPVAFRKACTKFHELALPEPHGDSQKIHEVLCAALKPIDQQLHTLIREVPAKDGYPMALLGQRMHSLYSIRITEHPEKNWRNYLTDPSRSGMYDCDPKGPTARVRLKTP